MGFLSKYFGTIKRKNEDLLISAKEARKIQKEYNYDQIYYNLKEYLNPIIKATIKSNQNEIRIKGTEKMFSDEEICILEDLGYNVEIRNLVPQNRPEIIQFIISW